MTEEKLSNGLRVWTPTDPQDTAFLKMAAGATFGETTFPSGWRSPPGRQVARKGKLYETAN